jgi:hypothetical protein
VRCDLEAGVVMVGISGYFAVFVFAFFTKGTEHFMPDSSEEGYIT